MSLTLPLAEELYKIASSKQNFRLNVMKLHDVLLEAAHNEKYDYTFKVHKSFFTQYCHLFNEYGYAHFCSLNNDECHYDITLKWN